MRLRRTSPDGPGWTRRRAGRGFTYLDEEGERLDPDHLERVKALVIPPAWEDVWISPVDNGHLQAVGTDEAGRRQYLYHPEWRARRDEEKFERSLMVGRRLPRARRRADDDLDLPGMPLERALALSFRLLDLGLFRIGSDTYAEDHGSIGLTTLSREHVRRRAGAVTFTFVGKSAVEQQITITDSAVSAAVADLRRRRGGFEELLAHKEHHRWRRVTPEQVNAYLNELFRAQVSAKDLRTWHATVIAAVALAEHDVPGASAGVRRRHRAAAMREVAALLGNTPAVAQRSYVDPRVLDLYDEGTVVRLRRPTHDPRTDWEAAERAVLRLVAT